MKNLTQTIRKVVTFLNNPDEQGGFWLPNIQRPFVWSEEQICRLCDSILRQYPISTLLIWKTTSPIRRRKFIDNWKPSLRLSDFYVPEDNKRKCLVLDGQQRLQSLYIALLGSYDGKELYINILTGELLAPDDMKYKFEFRNTANSPFPWLKFKELVFTSKTNRQLARDIETHAERKLTENEKDKVEANLELIAKTFRMDETVSYQELDSLDNPELYRDDDVVEIFIRANSGGTRLSKSDLLFSLLTASWEVADEEIAELLESLNKHGFDFDRDFVLKTCLTLLGWGAQYEIEKFRKPGVREQIQDKWDNIANAIRDVLDFVRGKTFIRCDKALPSYLVLIPLIHLRYRFPQAWREARDIETYLLRCSLAGAFSGSSDNLLDALFSKLNQIQTFDLEELFSVIRSQGRILEITEDRFWRMGYGSSTVHLLFNLWYRDFNYTPAYEKNLPQVDHIFPQSFLKKIKTENPRTGRRDVLKFTEATRNQLANCMLLTQEENGFQGKRDQSPEEWFSTKPNDYLDMHLIPPDRELWKLNNFEQFIEERKKLITARFAHLLVQPQSSRA